MNALRSLPFLLLLLALLPGCNRGKKVPAFDPAAPIAVTPSAARVPMNGRLEFAAQRSGRPDSTVIWEILEPEGGVILSRGAYLAPAYPGTFTVLARDPRNPANRTRAQVQVQVVAARPGSPKHAECYDPGTLAWSPVGALREGRADHTATLLQDGRVLIVGGRPQPGEFPSGTAEVFDPATGAFRFCRGGLLAPRAGHSALLLRDGRVLILGGIDRAGPSSALVGQMEVYDPKEDRFHQLGKGPEGNQLMLLEDGRVLVAGNGVAILDPATGQTMTTGLEKLGHFVDACLVPWKSGKVLVLGGALLIDERARVAFQAAVVLDTRTLEVTQRGRVVVPRWGAIAWQRGDEVWLVGGMTMQRFSSVLSFRGQALGYGTPSPTPTVDILDTAQWDFRPGPRLAQPLPLAPGAFLGTGTWFQAGDREIASAQSCLVDLPSGEWRQGPPMSMARRSHTLTRLQDGRVLVVGGLGPWPPSSFQGGRSGWSQPNGGRP